MTTYRLPNDEVTYDEKKHHDAWERICEELKDLFPAYRIVAFDPGISFGARPGAPDGMRIVPFTMSVRAAVDLLRKINRNPLISAGNEPHQYNDESPACNLCGGEMGRDVGTKCPAGLSEALSYLEVTYLDAKDMIGDGGRERCLKQAIESVISHAKTKLPITTIKIHPDLGPMTWEYVGTVNAQDTAQGVGVHPHKIFKYSYYGVPRKTLPDFGATTWDVWIPRGGKLGYSDAVIAKWQKSCRHYFCDDALAIMEKWEAVK